MRDIDTEYILENTHVIQYPRLKNITEADSTFMYSVLFEDMDRINLTYIHEGMMEMLMIQQVSEEEVADKLMSMGIDPYLLEGRLPKFMKSQTNILKRHIRNETAACSIEEAIDKVRNYPGGGDRLIVATVEGHIPLALMLGIHQAIQNRSR